MGFHLFVVVLVVFSRRAALVVFCMFVLFGFGCLFRGVVAGFPRALVLHREFACALPVWCDSRESCKLCLTCYSLQCPVLNKNTHVIVSFCFTSSRLAKVLILSGCSCLRICVYVCIKDRQIHGYICIPRSTDIFICICMCIYIYIYIYICIHVCIYIYIYTHTCTTCFFSLTHT